MAKKTSRKTKKSAKKSAKKKKLAKTAPTKKPVKKPAKKSTKKTGAKATSKAKAAKSAAKPAAKAAVKRPRAKSRTSRTSSSARNAIAPLADEKAKEANKPKKPGKASLKPVPEQTDEAAGKKLPASLAVKPAPSQHLFANLLARVHAACRALAEEGGWSAGIDLSRVVVEPPRDVAHGDMATNAAMVLAKDAKAKPRDLAEQIATKLRADDLIAAVDVAGPGFINLTLKPEAWAEALRTVLREDASYGRIAPLAGAAKVNVEYVSANPTGPMHVGHCRGAVFGDALCSLLQFAGYDVTREYYVNDAGAQVDVLARSG